MRTYNFFYNKWNIVNIVNHRVDSFTWKNINAPRPQSKWFLNVLRNILALKQPRRPCTQWVAVTQVKWREHVSTGNKSTQFVIIFDGTWMKWTVYLSLVPSVWHLSVSHLISFDRHSTITTTNIERKARLRFVLILSVLKGYCIVLV